MKIKFIVCGLFLGVTITTHAQSVGPSTINSAGASNVIAGKTYEFSIGEMALVNTASGSNIIVTNGVLQPNPAPPPPSGVKDINYLSHNLKVYPNPSDNILHIQPDLESGGQLSYQLYDALGRIMLSGEFKLTTGREKQTVHMEQLAAGSYVLSLNMDKKGLHYNASFNVQKIN